MFALELLFSPLGRMKRLNYVLLSSLFSSLNLGLLMLMGLRSGAGLWELVSAGPMLLFKASPFLAAFSMIGLWIQACLVLKRSRDFSGGTVTGLLFIALWAAPYVAPAALDSYGFGEGMKQFVFAIPAALVGLVLIFADTRQEDGRAASLDHSVPGVDRRDQVRLGSLDHSTDLVARAAALRPVESPPMTSPVENSPRGRESASNSFGRRKSLIINSQP